MSLNTLLFCGLGLKLIPLIVKAGLAILGIASHRALRAPAPMNLSPALMALCPVTQVVSGALTLLSLALETALSCADLPSLISWPIRMALFAASVLGSTALSLTSCAADQLCACTHGLLLAVLTPR